jgi:hypothetical protein
MMPNHRYALGARVRVIARAALSAKTAGIYTVVRLLPDRGDGDQQYRIKSETETHERVVTESQLTAI